MSTIPQPSGYIRVDGTKLVDGDGKEVILRGAGLGGWMKYVIITILLPLRLYLNIYFSMENFITGYPGCEFQIREELANVIGQEKSEFFFDKV